MSTADLSTPESTFRIRSGLLADATAVWGSGWQYLSTRQQRAELALAAIERLYHQDDSIDPARVVERLSIYAEFVLAVYGLDDEEEES